MNLSEIFARLLVVALLVTGTYLMMQSVQQAKQLQAEAEKTAIFEGCVQSLYRSILDDTSSDKRIPSRSEAEAICMQGDYL